MPARAAYVILLLHIVGTRVDVAGNAHPLPPIQVSVAGTARWSAWEGAASGTISLGAVLPSVSGPPACPKTNADAAEKRHAWQPSLLSTPQPARAVPRDPHAGPNSRTNAPVPSALMSGAQRSAPSGGPGYHITRRTRRKFWIAAGADLAVLAAAATAPPVVSLAGVPRLPPRTGTPTLVHSHSATAPARPELTGLRVQPGARTVWISPVTGQPIQGRALHTGSESGRGPGEPVSRGHSSREGKLWSRAEDDALRLGVALYGRNYLTILRNAHFARALGDRSPLQLQVRWEALQADFREHQRELALRAHAGGSPGRLEGAAGVGMNASVAMMGMSPRHRALLSARSAENLAQRLGELSGKRRWQDDAGSSVSAGGFRGQMPPGNGVKSVHKRLHWSQVSTERRMVFGPWTLYEHSLMLRGLREVGWGYWTQIAAEYIPSRTALQVATHAANFFFGVRRPLPAAPARLAAPEGLPLPCNTSAVSLHSALSDDAASLQGGAHASAALAACLAVDGLGADAATLVEKGLFDKALESRRAYNGKGDTDAEAGLKVERPGQAALHGGQLVWLLSHGLPAWPAVLTHPYKSSKHVWTGRQQRVGEATADAGTPRNTSRAGSRSRRLTVMTLGSYELLTCREQELVPFAELLIPHEATLDQLAAQRARAKPAQSLTARDLVDVLLADEAAVRETLALSHAAAAAAAEGPSGTASSTQPSRPAGMLPMLAKAVSEAVVYFAGTAAWAHKGQLPELSPREKALVSKLDACSSPLALATLGRAILRVNASDMAARAFRFSANRGAPPRKASAPKTRAGSQDKGGTPQTSPRRYARVACICGALVERLKMRKHRTSTRHQDYMFVRQLAALSRTNSSAAVGAEETVDGDGLGQRFKCTDLSLSSARKGSGDQNGPNSSQAEVGVGSVVLVCMHLYTHVHTHTHTHTHT